MARRNWKRGLFRIWFVLSILWVSLWGWLAISDWPDLPLKGERFYIKHPDDNPTLEKVLTTETEEEFIKSVKIEGGGDPTQFIYWETTPLGYRTIIGKKWTDERAKERLRFADEMITQQTNARQWEHLFNKGSVAVIWPLAVLVLGSALAWAFSGFRKEEGK